ncbi:unnamed protein product [Hymenolepis diminuta]|uniref:Uncharacterized protein n=2 Tax=Hymenolepis diminuta TaxID=6216 RepID=A0A3P6WE46_HYMDI|nr:unnamed protein product [Hymenolepis diminuta]
MDTICYSTSEFAFAWTQPNHQNGRIQGVTRGSQYFLHPPYRSLDLKPAEMDGLHCCLFAVTYSWNQKFSLALISLTFVLISWYYISLPFQKEVEHYEAIEGQLGGRSLAGGGTYLSGRIGPSTLFTRSVYANQSQFGGGVVLNVPAPGNAPTQTVEIGNNNFYPGSEPFGSQLTPLQEDPLVGNEGIFSDQASGMYGHQSMVRGPYLSDNTPTHSVPYDYRRVQEQ